MRSDRRGLSPWWHLFWTGQGRSRTRQLSRRLDICCMGHQTHHRIIFKVQWYLAWETTAMRDPVLKDRTSISIQYNLSKRVESKRRCYCTHNNANVWIAATFYSLMIYALCKPASSLDIQVCCISTSWKLGIGRRFLWTVWMLESYTHSLCW